MLELGSKLDEQKGGLFIYLAKFTCREPPAHSA